jgi:hypothetical protein
MAAAYIDAALNRGGGRAVDVTLASIEASKLCSGAAPSVAKLAGVELLNLLLYTEPGWNMHLPEEIGIDSLQADRSPDERYRTAPPKGLWTHSTGGFYHDGRFAT